MPIKSILIHLTIDDEVLARCRYAIKLAAEFQSKVYGVYVGRPTPPLMASANTSLAAADANATLASISYETQVEYLEEQKQDLQKILMEGLGVDACFPWVVIENQSRESFMEITRCQDLIIVGEDFSVDDPLEIISNPTTKLAVASSCPVLVLPKGFQESPAFESPLVAWNGSKEASRAVRDAIPFLQRADSVTIVQDSEQYESFTPLENDEPSLLQYLKLQEVDACFVESNVKSDAFGDVLSKRAQSEKHDLLVLGAYDHSRVREMLLGSTTRSLLGKVSIPILLSH